MLLGSGVTVEFWETAATYRLKDAHLGQAGWWGQGYLDPLTPRGVDSAVFTLVFFLHAGSGLGGHRSSLRAAQIAHLDHHCGNIAPHSSGSLAPWRPGLGIHAYPL